MRRPAGTLGLCCAMLAAIFAVGCESDHGRDDGVVVLDVFGRSGRGPGEFLYPRAIATADDGSLFVIDKTGRVQHLSPRGVYLGGFTMPQVEAGKPTGLCVAPAGPGDGGIGRLYVADTHYHRVMIFSPGGKLLGRFGRYGDGPGCFIYPTDVAVSRDGRIFVSEYGGNDRVSIFSAGGVFLDSFGSAGEGRGQFSRPAALCIDHDRGRLYIADACNHRVAIYTLSGELLGYIGSGGRPGGGLRYPYDLALLSGGDLLVCEYGNNRIQRFRPDGGSVGVFGRAGRAVGELAYPWGVAADRSFAKNGRVYVVDAGNNRVQVWRLF